MLLATQQQTQEENEKLRSIHQQLIQQLNTMKLEQIQTNNENYLLEKQSILNENDQLKEQIKSLTAKYDNLQGINSQLKEISQNKAIQDQKIQNFQQTIYDQETELRQLLQQNSELQKRILELEKENDSLAQKCASIQAIDIQGKVEKEVQQLREKLTTEFETVKKELVQAYERKLKEGEDQKVLLEKEKSEQIIQIQQQNIQYSKLEAEYATYKNQQTQLSEKQIQSFQEEVKTLKSKIEFLERNQKTEQQKLSTDKKNLIKAQDASSVSLAFAKKNKIFDQMKPLEFSKQSIEMDPTLSKTEILEILENSQGKLPHSQNQQEEQIINSLLVEVHDQQQLYMHSNKAEENILLEKKENVYQQYSNKRDEFQEFTYDPKIDDILPSEKLKFSGIYSPNSNYVELIYPFNNPKTYYENKTIKELKGQLISFQSINLKGQSLDPDALLSWKKLSLLNKGIIYRNREIQIGITLEPNKSNLIANIYFINVSSLTIQELKTDYNENESLSIEISPQNKSTQIRANTQFRQQLKIDVRKFPLQKLFVDLFYKIDNQLITKSILVPINVNKFLCNASIRVSDFKIQWQNFKQTMIKSDFYTLDDNLIGQAADIKKFFPYFAEINSIKNRDYYVGLSEFKVGGLLILQQSGTQILTKFIFNPINQFAIQMICLNQDLNFNHKQLMIYILQSYLEIFMKL